MKLKTRLAVPVAGLVFLSMSAFASSPEEMMIKGVQDDNATEIQQAVSAGWNLREDLHVGSGPSYGASQLLPALSYAANLGKIEAIKALVKLGAKVKGEPNWVGYEPIHYAASSNQVGAIQTLVSLGADVSSMPKVVGLRQTSPALVIAAGRGNIEAVQALLSLGANPNLRQVDENMGQEEYSALHNVACATPDSPSYKNRLAIANILLKAGANPEITAKFSAWTPLLCAAYVNNIEVAKILVKAGANVNQLFIESFNGVTTSNFALELAGSGDNSGLEMVRFLVESGANVNQKNHEGTTALHEAAYFGKLDVVKYLISKGAWVNEVSREDGRNDVHQNKSTPMDFALARGNTEVVRALEKAGGKRFSDL